VPEVEPGLSRLPRDVQPLGEDAGREVRHRMAIVEPGFNPRTFWVTSPTCQPLSHSASWLPRADRWKREQREQVSRLGESERRGAAKADNLLRASRAAHTPRLTGPCAA
jgi:hypothetical protein